MNRLLSGVFGVLALLVMALPVQASTFTDVPTDHWAYGAIDYLQAAGLVEGFPDGTFGGDRQFTRYEMAMVIARVFTKMQDFQSMIDNSGGSMEDRIGADIDLSEVYARLDKLADEFRDELSDLGARVTAVEDEQARMRGDIDDLSSLIKDSGLSGEARVRTGAYLNTGSQDLTNELGWESLIKINYFFQPEPNIDFKLTLTSAEVDGAVGTGFIPGQNNETPQTYPGNPPHGNSSEASSFVLDEAYIRYCFTGSSGALGWCPRITLGRQYFSQGEFGLAGDNGYRSNMGLRFDSTWGETWDAYMGLYRMEAINDIAPWDNQDTLNFQSSALTYEGDDMLLMGLEYHSGEAKVPGHDYQLVMRLDGAINGYGNENYISVSGNAEIPFFGDTFLNGIRGEWLYVPTNVSDFNPSDDLGLTNSSFIVEVDAYNNGQTKVAISGAQIAQIEALPVLANVDNDPFSEWDFTVNGAADAFNLSREGRNYLPSDFKGVGIHAEHTFGNSLHTGLYYYSGSRVDAGNSDRPGLFALKFRYPFSNNSTMGLDIITAGERNGLEDPITLVRGEYKINF